MFDLEDIYHATSENPSENEANPDAVSWEIMGIFTDYLLEQGLTLQAEGIVHLIESGLRPRSGVLSGEEEKGIQYWWYYCEPASSVRGEVLNVVPLGLEKSLSGPVREESSSSGIIVYPTFTEAVQDFGIAWERWTVAKQLRE